MKKLETKRQNAYRRCRWLIWLGCMVVVVGIENSTLAHAGSLATNSVSQIITNTGQFQKVFMENADMKDQFYLSGTVTMVDIKRNLFVLQDDQGAIAFNLSGEPMAFRSGQRISIQGDRAMPYFESFPSYPYQPSGRDIRATFEAPPNSGEYHLTRMRGYLHPSVSGDYTFWIASDNSSELWLSGGRPAIGEQC